MRTLFLATVVVLTLTACGPSAYEQAQRTVALVKCRQAATFDQQCSDAFDVQFGPGQGEKEHARLVATAPVSVAVERQQEQQLHDRMFGSKAQAPVVLDGVPETKKQK